MNSELEYILQYKHFLILNPPYLNKVMVIRVAKPHYVVQSCTQSNQCGTKLFWKLYVHCGFFDFAYVKITYVKTKRSTKKWKDTCDNLRFSLWGVTQ